MNLGTTQKGLLEVEMAEGAKIQLCSILNHFMDLQLRHRVESLVAFSEGFVGEVQQVTFLSRIYVFTIIVPGPIWRLNRLGSK